MYLYGYLGAPTAPSGTGSEPESPAARGSGYWYCVSLTGPARGEMLPPAEAPSPIMSSRSSAVLLPATAYMTM